MPFASKRQSRWMFANHPAMAHEWAEHTPSIKALPERVKHKKRPQRHKQADLLDLARLAAHLSVIKLAADALGPLHAQPTALDQGAMQPNIGSEVQMPQANPLVPRQAPPQQPPQQPAPPQQPPQQPGAFKPSPLLSVPHPRSPAGDRIAMIQSRFIPPAPPPPPSPATGLKQARDLLGISMRGGRLRPLLTQAAAAVKAANDGGWAIPPGYGTPNHWATMGPPTLPGYPPPRPFQPLPLNQYPSYGYGQGFGPSAQQGGNLHPSYGYGQYPQQGGGQQSPFAGASSPFAGPSSPFAGPVDPQQHIEQRQRALDTALAQGRLRAPDHERLSGNLQKTREILQSRYNQSQTSAPASSGSPTGAPTGSPFDAPAPTWAGVQAQRQAHEQEFARRTGLQSEVRNLYSQHVATPGAQDPAYEAHQNNPAFKALVAQAQSGNPEQAAAANAQLHQLREGYINNMNPMELMKNPHFQLMMRSDPAKAQALLAHTQDWGQYQQQKQQQDAAWGETQKQWQAYNAKNPGGAAPAGGAAPVGVGGAPPGAVPRDAYTPGAPDASAGSAKLPNRIEDNSSSRVDPTRGPGAMEDNLGKLDLAGTNDSAAETKPNPDAAVASPSPPGDSSGGPLAQLKEQAMAAQRRSRAAGTDGVVPSPVPMGAHGANGGYGFTPTVDLTDAPETGLPGGTDIHGQPLVDNSPARQMDLRGGGVVKPERGDAARALGGAAYQANGQTPDAEPADVPGTIQTMPAEPESVPGTIETTPAAPEEGGDPLGPDAVGGLAQAGQIPQGGPLARIGEMAQLAQNAQQQRDDAGATGAGGEAKDYGGGSVHAWPQGHSKDAPNDQLGVIPQAGGAMTPAKSEASATDELPGTAAGPMRPAPSPGAAAPPSSAYTGVNYGGDPAGPSQPEAEPGKDYGGGSVHAWPQGHSKGAPDDGEGLAPAVNPAQRQLLQQNPGQAGMAATWPFQGEANPIKDLQEQGIQRGIGAMPTPPTASTTSAQPPTASQAMAAQQGSQQGNQTGVLPRPASPPPPPPPNNTTGVLPPKPAAPPVQSAGAAPKPAPALKAGPSPKPSVPAG